MPRAKNESGDTTAKTRRSTSTTSSPDVTEAKRPQAAEAKGPTLVATLPAHHTPASAEEEIRRRAYELYEQDGRQHGRDREHWFRAEAEVLGRSGRGQKSA